MKISELIKELESKLTEHGDIEANIYKQDFSRYEVSFTELRYKKIIYDCDAKPEFWFEWMNKNEENKGEPVLFIG